MTPSNSLSAKPSSKPKHIGIVGVTYEGAALCYRTICFEAREWMGKFNHPEITLHTFSINDYKEPSDAEDWDEIGRRLLRSAEILAGAGADLLICPDNTVHVSIDAIRDQSPLPWLHIAEEVAREAESTGYHQILVLGTQPLMEGPVYPSRFEPRGIICRTPDLEVRIRIQKIIVEELIYGHLTETARTYFQSVIQEAEQQGCDAVALACTEIPLLIAPEDSVLPTLDSTRLLARAALREAVAQLR